MAASFNFPNLTQIPWLPVRFQTADHQYKGKYSSFITEDGARFALNECLKNYKDFTFNKNNGFFLSNVVKATDFLQDVKEAIDSKALEKVLTPLAVKDSPYDKIVAVENNRLVVSERASVNTIGYPTNFSAKDSLTLVFTKDLTHSSISEDAEEDLVSIETQEFSKANSNIPSKMVLTWAADNSSLIFKPKIYPDSYSQKFAYMLSKEGIVLFKPNSNYRFAVQRSGTEFVLGTVNSSGGVALSNSFFLKFVSFSVPTSIDNNITPSYLTKYTIDKLDVSQSLHKDNAISNLGYTQNYLGSFAYHSPRLDNGFATYDIFLHGLKNYQTPEYNYSFNSNYTDNVAGTHRIYDAIFSGTNQKEGTENVCLGFQANTTEFVFPVDKETLFSFPPTSYSIPLASGGFQADGATAGHTPFVSDRISVRQIDYTSKMPGLPQPPSITSFTNTWLCAWLWDSPNGKVWMDRFYNSAYYTQDKALQDSVRAYNDKLNPSEGYIIDVPSVIKLEPGAFYRYYHVGPDTSKNYLPLLDGTIGSSLGSKTLEVLDWSAEPLTDGSGYKNNGIVYSEETSILSKDEWNLNGTNHAIFPAKTSLLEQHHFTTSLWVNVPDWSNIRGKQVFGNFYDSGFGLLNEAFNGAPLISYLDNDSGQTVTLNYNLKVVNKTPSFSSTDPSRVLIARLPSMNYWVYDPVAGYGYKYDPDGKLLFRSKKIYGVTQMELDQDNNLYLFQPVKQIVSVLDPDGQGITKGNIRISNSKVKRIEIFKFKNTTGVVEVFGNVSVIDNNGNLWQTLGSNLYKSPYNTTLDLHGPATIFATVGPVQQISCDADNNIWLLHDIDRVSKLTPDGKFFSVRIGKRSNLPESPCDLSNTQYRFLNFVQTPDLTTTGCSSTAVRNLTVIIDNRDNELYLLSKEMDLISKIDLSALYSSPSIAIYCNGDFTGYQFSRKFSIANKNISWKLKIADAYGKNSQIVTLPYIASTLSPGWHHFALVVNTPAGYIKSYIDSIEVASKSLNQSHQVFYDYRSSLLLGADSVKNGILNDIIGIQKSYKFVGKVSELRIYNKSFSKGDIEHLYFSSDKSDNRSDLVWNMPIGNRNYIEEIKHWFQMQMPGSKSRYFNINIRNMPLDEKYRDLVEEAIRRNIEKLAPAHTSLYKINWI